MTEFQKQLDKIKMLRQESTEKLEELDREIHKLQIMLWTKDEHNITS